MRTIRIVVFMLVLGMLLSTSAIFKTEEASAIDQRFDLKVQISGTFNGKFIGPETFSVPMTVDAENGVVAGVLPPPEEVFPDLDILPYHWIWWQWPWIHYWWIVDIPCFPCPDPYVNVPILEVFNSPAGFSEVFTMTGSRGEFLQASISLDARQRLIIYQFNSRVDMDDRLLDPKLPTVDMFTYSAGNQAGSLKSLGQTLMFGEDGRPSVAHMEGLVQLQGKEAGLPFGLQLVGLTTLDPENPLAFESKVVVSSDVAGAEPEKVNTLAYEYNHTMRINNEEAFAFGVGELNFDEGIIYLEAEINKYIQGYGLAFSSVVTCAGGCGGGGDVAIVADGAIDIRSLMEDGFSYTARAVTRDEYADIVTNIEVFQEGDRVIANLVSEGTANYPPVVAMGGPIEITQIPTENGFIEVGTKRLITDDGEMILSSQYVEYEGIPLDQPQHRQLSVEVLDISDDALNLTLQYNGILTPLDGATVEYINEMNINGETAIAQAKGFADRLSGIIFVDAEIDQYIEGYQPWCISPFTAIIQSLSPAFSLQVDEAVSLYDFQAYESFINIEDSYAMLEIAANVQIEGDFAQANLITTGNAAYPIIDCPDRMRMEFFQSNSDGGIFEEGTKLLISEDSEPIEIPSNAFYDGVKLERDQYRFVEVIATGVSDDLRKISLIYRSVTSPESLTAR